MSQISKKQAINKLWKKGVLHWKLHPSQKQLYDSFKNSKEKIVTFLSSRRIGKSYTLFIIACETCLQTKNAIVKFLFPTGKAASDVMLPIFRQVFEDAPESVIPEYIASRKTIKFKNGSEIQMAGSDNKRVDSLRGAYANLCIVDEAGFCDDLGYGVRSVLMPTTATTAGKIILSSTPPISPDHEFIEFIRQAEKNKTLVKKTIFDNTMLTPAEIKDIISAYPGGMAHTEFRREYLCEIIVDADTAVFPEFTDSLEKEIVRPHIRPNFFDYYVAADIGFVDYTAILFGYLDFTNSLFVVEDEIVENKLTTVQIAEKIKEKERILLYNPQTNEQIKPLLRVSDNNLILINDLAKLHGLNFVPTRKDDRDSAINNARLLLEAKKIVISPKCTNLISHLKSASWKKSAVNREIARSKEGGHYDAAMALVYLLRNVNWNKSPYPKGFFDPSSSTHFIRKGRYVTNPSEFGSFLSKQRKNKKSL